MYIILVCVYTYKHKCLNTYPVIPGISEVRGGGGGFSPCNLCMHSAFYMEIEMQK